MRVRSCVFLVDFLQFLITEDVVVGVFPCFLLASVELKPILFISLLLVRGSDCPVALFNFLFLGLKSLHFFGRNCCDTLILLNVFMDLGQIFNVLI